MQVADTTPTRTDSYNLLYPTPTQNAGFGDEFYTLDYLASPPGGIFNIDCVGRLIVESPIGGPPLFGAVDFFTPGFEVVYFL